MMEMATKYMVRSGSMEEKTAVDIRGLYKQYGNLVAVNGIDLKIKEGEVFGLLGPNGSGKSTIINCLLSLVRYDRGTINIFGSTMKESEVAIKRKIGVIMQEVAVFEELTVYENIEYFCSLYVKDRKKVKDLTEDAISFVSLEDFKIFYPQKLSGGLLRRLNIACGIAHRPKLIILDEPTVAVDPQSRNKILKGIQKLNEQGATIIYTTHYMEEVEQICNNIAIIDKGNVVALGTKKTLTDSINMGETIVVEAQINHAVINKLKSSGKYRSIEYFDNVLKVKAKKESNSFIGLIDFLQQNNVAFHKIYFDMPTLNDVFLEITGKELR